jgi:2-dehydro-3-deoxyglucarate aldolase/4-hydroxy-2-oxoheptanedioate aldolase
MANPLKAKLAAGQVVYGQMVMELFTPGLAKMAAAAGLDFLIYDQEHGRCDMGLLASMIDSCNGTGVAPLVRVPDLNAAPLSRALDLGARGIMVPRVETADQARDIVAQLKYAPQGRRGVALGLAHDSFRPQGAAYFDQANQDTLVIALLETARAYDNLEDILAVPGIDIAWMGHYDLTVSMGIPAQFDHPRFLDAMRRLIAVSAQNGIAVGFLPATPEDARRWIDEGIRVVSLNSDIGLYTAAARRCREALP